MWETRNFTREINEENWNEEKFTQITLNTAEKVLLYHTPFIVIDILLSH